MEAENQRRQDRSNKANELYHQTHDKYGHKI